MKEEVGDKGYYYNKNDGLTQQVFDGLDIEETRLMKSNFTDVLEFVKENYSDLVAE